MTRETAFIKARQSGTTAAEIEAAVQFIQQHMARALSAIGEVRVYVMADGTVEMASEGDRRIVARMSADFYQALLDHPTVKTVEMELDHRGGQLDGVFDVAFPKPTLPPRQPSYLSHDPTKRFGRVKKGKR